MSKLKTKRCLLDDFQPDPDEPGRSKWKIEGRNGDNNSKGKNFNLKFTSKDLKEQRQKVVGSSRTIKRGNNNNTIPSSKIESVKNKMLQKEHDVAKTKTAKTKTKVTSIIQTRGMKTKAARLTREQIESELKKLSQIDSLTSCELADGEQGLNDEDSDVNHDGVELSVNGSDFEDDIEDPRTSGTSEPPAQGHIDSTTESDVEEMNNGIEPGELSSSEDEVDVRPKKSVASKVVRAEKEKIPCKEQNNDRFSKFKHLREDPDFRDFLFEVLDDRDKLSVHERKRGGANCVDCNISGSSGKRDKSKSGYDTDNHPNTPFGQSSQNGHQQEIKNNSVVHPNRLFKSPSDTTLYSPGFRKANSDEVVLIEKISAFVESIRLDSNRAEKERNQQFGSASSSHRKQEKSVSKDVRRIERRSGNVDEGDSSPGRDISRTADQLLVQAEKFKAKV